jgi:molybdenum cofactor guanylyltransferase
MIVDGSIRFTCEICILAGGRSQRMGRDKSRLPLGRKTMLAQIQATANSTGWPVRLISRDLVPGCGPMGGIHTALQTTLRDAVLFLACDMPLLEVDLLNHLVDGFRSQGRPIFLSSGGRAGFPFILPAQALAEVANRLEQGNLSLQGLAKQLRAILLPVPIGSKYQVLNANTPREWKTIQRLWNERWPTHHLTRLGLGEQHVRTSRSLQKLVKAS